jgi:hypothetical protein
MGKYGCCKVIFAPLPKALSPACETGAGNFLTGQSWDQFASVAALDYLIMHQVG